MLSAKENRVTDSGAEIIENSDKIADVICAQNVKESAYVRRGSEIDSAEPEALCCDGGATSPFSSSLMNCSEVTERVVPIHTAQAGTVMLTTVMLTRLSQDIFGSRSNQ